jgi:hypothetical protein
MRPVIHACNEIEKILFSSIDPSEKECARIFVIACTALRQVPDDREFSDALDKMDKLREEHCSDFQAITELDHFVGSFLAIERDLLLKAGLSPVSVDFVLKQFRAVREEIRNKSPEPQAIMAEIKDTRDDVCSIAQDLNEKQQAKADREKIRSSARKGVRTEGQSSLSTQSRDSGRSRRSRR